MAADAARRPGVARLSLGCYEILGGDPDHPQARALVAAAALLRHAVERGRAPCWSASNPISQGLARRLGLEPAGQCEVLFLT